MSSSWWSQWWEQSPSGGNEPTPKKAPTYRIRGVPNDWDKDRLESFLTERDSSSRPSVRSLAVEFHGRSQTATVLFENTNRLPRKIPLPVSGGEFRSLTLDHGFLSITSLFTPSQQDHKVDIIAISGLSGHAFGSFKERNGDYMWLRDSLPYALSDENGNIIARVMIYGYESSLPNSDSFQNLEDLGTALHSTLRTLAFDGTFKPLVFIAHSLGGLVVKQLLIALNNSRDELDKKLRRAVCGIAFFGVPHDGMDIGSLIPMAGDGPNRFLLESLGSYSSQVLSTQQRDFTQALGGQGETEIISFYETRMSPTAVKDDEGRWSMTGEPAVLVSKASATHCRPWENGPEHTCAIYRTHSEMVKFADQDPEYDKVLGRLESLARRAILMRRSPIPPNLSRSERDCLKSLAFEQMQSRGNDIDRAVKGTCEWLLKHQTCRSWATSHRGLLWIKGKPGAGKSTLLKYALSKQRDMPSARDGDLVLSFFFHGRGDALQRTPLGLFRSLLHQILKQIPEALSNLVDSYQEKLREMGAPPEAWQWHPEELWHFLEASLPRIVEIRPIWLFVDALDECGEADAVDLAMKFKSLLDSVSSTAAQGIHICFSCRHYPIPPDLEGAFEICVEYENGHDVSAYVRQKLSETSVRDASSIADLITARASGVFMWARLVLERVLRLERQRASWGKIRDEICSIPPDMDSLYMDHIQRMEDKAASLRLIQWLCFAVKPLSLVEVYWALAINADCQQEFLAECGSEEDYGTDEDMERRVISLSCGLAESVTSSETSIVQFIHQSVKDFFVDKGLLALDSSSATVDEAIGRAHFSLSRTCIRYFSMEEIGRSRSDNGHEKEALFPFICYAVTAWTTHAHESNRLGVSQHDLLQLLHWPSNSLLNRWAHVLNLVVTNGHDRQPRKTNLVQVAARYGIPGALSAILQDAHQITANVDLQDEDERTPLSWAAESGHESIVELLLDTGRAEIDASDCYAQTPLSWAAENGREAIVKLLLGTGEVKVNSRDSHYHTPLSWAAENGHDAVVKLLLDTERADVNVKDKFGQTPLSFAAENGHEAVVKLLLAPEQVVVDAKDSQGQTPLCYAAYRGHVAVVRLLLDIGQAEADIKDKEGRTPLSLAAANGHETVVHILLDRGVGVDSRDGAGRTALSWAAANAHDAMVKLLYSRGAEIDSKDNQYRTPLSWAAANGREAVVALLLDEGVEVDSKSLFDQTPLLLAAANGHEGVVALLLNKGAAVNVKESDGRTPLVRAARRGHEAVVRLLLERNAEVDVENEYGETALSLATRYGHQGVVELLKAHSIPPPGPPL
ncbi:Ankyrin repeat domain-containing protein 50 [Trichoderma ghanense]|uniref:Ankyrin repeat domain-containing protein 50 n=1 Tax=Trichoderma ghanense TaxID=65468 RepID=A0ABY2H0V2_9HYPO